MTVSRNANGLARPAAIVAPVWTHIAQPQQPRAGRIRLAEAENGEGGTGTRDRGPGPARVPVLVPLLAQGLTPGHGHDRGRATGEAVTENALADLAPEAGPRVAAGVAAGNASVEERGVVRRMCVFCLSVTSSLYLMRVSEEREERTAEKWGGIGCGGQPVG